MNKIAFGIILTILIIIGVIYKFFDRILLFGLFICISELLYNGGTESYTLIGCSIIIISMIIMYYTKLSTILLILSIVVISDIFQEFSGKFFGKNKIGWISPNKTYEGYIGGYIGMLIFYFIYNNFTKNNFANINFYYINIIYLLGISGDLFYSFIKRKVGIKDYSDLLLSHGGVLDRLDSFIFALLAIPLL
jgi:phosphatidate cytidylyltransferase